MLKTTPFDAADYLTTPQARAEYMTAAFETGDLEFIRDALGVVVKSHRRCQSLGPNRLDARRPVQVARQIRQPRIRDHHAHRPRAGADAVGTAGGAERKGKKRKVA